MQLLGIYIYEKTPKLIRKALAADWYPFGDYRKPAKIDHLSNNGINGGYHI